MEAGQAALEYRGVVRVDTNATRIAKAYLQLYLAKDIKDNKKGFFKYINNRKTRENVSPLLKGDGTMVTEDAEKAEKLNAFLASVFNANASPQEPLIQETREKAWRKEVFPLIEEDWVRNDLDKLDIHKSMGPQEMHLCFPCLAVMASEKLYHKHCA